MTIPTIDLSPVIQSYRVLADAKKQAIGNNPLGTIARTGLDIAEIAWKYIQSNDVTNAQAHTQKIQEKYQDLQNQMFLGPSNNGIDAEQFQQAVDQLGDELKAYKPRTPAGESVINDYSVNGFAQNTEAMVRQVAPILIKKQTDLLYSTLTEAGVASAKDGDPEAYINKLSGLESGLSKSREDEATAQAAATTAADEETLADQDLSRTMAQQSDAEKAGQGAAFLQGKTSAEAAKAAKTKAREEAAKKAGMQSEAVKSAAVAFEEAQATGTDPYRTLVREQVESSKLFTSTQIDEITNSFVNKRNNIFANNNVQARIEGRDYVGALQYVNDHTGYYPDAEAVKAARTEIETQRDGFTIGKFRGYVGEAQQPQNWSNITRLNEFIAAIGKDDQYNTQGTEGATGSNAAIDELTRRKDYLLSIYKGGKDDLRLEGQNELSKYVDNYMSGGARGSDQKTVLDGFYSIANKYDGVVNWKTDVIPMRDMLIDGGQGNTPVNEYLKMAYTSRDTMIKGKKGDALASAQALGVALIDGMEEFKLLYPDAKRPESLAEYSRLTSKAVRDAMDELTIGPKRSLTDPESMKWAAEYRRDIAEGKGEAFIGHTLSQGRLVVNPRIKAAFEASAKVVSSEFNRQHKDEGLEVGKNVIEYMDDAGRLTYFAKKPDGAIDVYHEAQNTKADAGPDSVLFFKEGLSKDGKKTLTSSFNPNNPKVKAFNTAAVEVAQAVQAGSVPIGTIDALAEKLKKAYAEYPTHSDASKQIYDDMMKRLTGAYTEYGMRKPGTPTNPTQEDYDRAAKGTK